MLIMGRTGAGKSSLQRNTILHALTCDVRWQVVGVDLKQMELSWMAGLPGVDAVATSARQAAALLGQVHSELHRRYELMAQHGVTSFVGLPERLDPVLVVVDELGAFTSLRDNSLTAHLLHTIVDRLSTISRLGRAAGVHCVLGTSTLNMEVLPGGLLSDMGVVAATGVLREAESQALFGSGFAARPVSGQGTTRMRSGGACSEFQSFHVSVDDVIDRVRATQGTRDGGTRDGGTRNGGTRDGGTRDGTANEQNVVGGVRFTVGADPVPVEPAKAARAESYNPGVGFVLPFPDGPAREGWDSFLLGTDTDTGKDVLLDLGERAPSVTHVTGTPGVGKTVLVTRLAAHVAAHGGGVVYCTTTTPDEYLAGFADVIVDTLEGFVAAVTAARVHANNRHAARESGQDDTPGDGPVLIVADNADGQLFGGAEVDAYIKDRVASSVHVVITETRRLPGAFRLPHEGNMVHLEQPAGHLGYGWGPVGTIRVGGRASGPVFRPAQWVPQPTD